MEAALFTMAKGKDPLPWPPIALGLLIPVSIMADDLPVHSHHSQTKMVLQRFPCHYINPVHMMLRRMESALYTSGIISNSGPLVSGGYCARKRMAVGAQ